MKLVVHDYAGHPFQVELSRELAKRGHDIVHAFFADDQGPKGELARRTDDPPQLSFASVGIGRRYEKGSLLRRRFDDVTYGRKIAELIGREKPDLVISGNTPTEAQERIVKACRAVPCGFVYWLQDFYSVAVAQLLKKKLGLFGAAVGEYYRLLERRQLRQANAIVTIAEQFRSVVVNWTRAEEKVFTIENWGAMNAIRPDRKDNEWVRHHGLVDTFNFVYAGTLALKHNPRLLIELARRTKGSAMVVVVSQGIGTERLASARRSEGLDNLILLPPQPVAELGQVLAAADVAVAVLEREAGAFSVPSKVQSYMCAGRAILLAAPADNPAAQVVAREEAGIVVDPTDIPAFICAADRLQRDAGLRRRAAQRGRTYAERTYEISEVANRFERVFLFARRELEQV
ncbi:glycosyltransferase family 4 protein [Bradyrhizobium sp. Tv2a-2]|uniref:glycosyltransferase family 4 protein n=1 Tax=Bradyrhizobium sp. Tv2a-2 TaxID=113395 RepID=UPI00040ED8CE|nr:glycosyltransferase family 4 protein [Bradyrhizobium sp. Tv2a-2]